MNSKTTRRSERYGNMVRGPSFKTEPETLADIKAMSAKLKMDQTEFIERAVMLYVLLEKHKAYSPILHYGAVSGRWFGILSDGLDDEKDGPDPLAALEAALQAED